ncbi:MAG: LysR family transcriptional regulator, partial [Erysipelotrichaceae bacterium]|nr:LysR family transcriptional regulator [Erysipelotrichaceae bacterium]
MNINQLYAFTAVYETGNFSESARKLKLTQSAITQLIHSLEKDLDTLLFIRSKRPITPTQNGRLYYDYAKKIIGLHEEAMKRIDKENNHFTL